jgi:NAD-dependent SIR2 family protein deacetylase
MITPEEPLDPGSVDRAARVIADADAILVAAGAGMGVDSGLPDFRGNRGFWNAYPPFARHGLSFVDLANPAWFERDPARAWGFYGHRLNLYRTTVPHPGFGLLRRWSERATLGAFVFTSNVDGQFQRAGFPSDRVVECHGSIHHLQCTEPCHDGIWEAEGVIVEVDEETFRATSTLPSCPRCGFPARPNVLMFGDWCWLSARASVQEERFGAWLDAVTGSRLVVVELGAGTAVPTVRLNSERLVTRLGATLIRVNPREPHVPPDQISLPAGARAALEAIDSALQGTRE